MFRSCGSKRRPIGYSRPIDLYYVNKSIIDRLDHNWNTLWLDYRAYIMLSIINLSIYTQICTDT